MWTPAPPDQDSAPFWAATLAGRLDLQRCDRCGRRVFYPRARCPACGSNALTWAPVSGKGTVHSFTVVHRAPRPELAPAVPYVVALIDLEEGARMMSQVVGCSPDQVRIGMPVEVEFRPATESAALPVFHPLTKADDRSNPGQADDLPSSGAMP